MKVETLNKIKRNFEEYKDYDTFKRLNSPDYSTRLHSYDIENEKLKSKFYTMSDGELATLQKLQKQIQIYKDYFSDCITVGLEEIVVVNILFERYLSEINVEDTENIYLEIGETILWWDCSDSEDFFHFFPSVDPEKEGIFAYINIEQNRPIYIGKEESKKFENDHNIVYPLNPEMYVLSTLLTKELAKIRADFLINSFETNQTEAKSALLKKYSFEAHQKNFDSYY